MYKCKNCGTEVYPCTMCMKCDMYFHPPTKSCNLPLLRDGYVSSYIVEAAEDLPLEVLDNG